MKPVAATVLNPGLGKRNLRVLQVLGNAIVGGMENYVRALASYLAAEGFELSLLCPFESPFTTTMREHGNQVFIAPLRDNPPWTTIELVHALVTEQRIDLIHAHLMNAHTVAALAGLVSNTPVVATIHGMNLHPQEISLARLAGTHTIVVCREAWSRALAAGIPVERLSLIPNGIEITRFTSTAAPRALLREVIGVAADEPLVGFVGRLAAEKGPDKFVRAAEMVLRKIPAARFVLVGSGQMEAEIKAMIGEAGLAGKILLAGTWTSPEQVYPALDLLLHTSRADAMPLTLLEAMAAGVPTIALGIGGIPEMIEAGVTGILIGTADWPGISSEYDGDWEGVGQAAIHLLNDPLLRQRMAASSIRRAAEFFDIRNSASATAALLRSLVEKSAFVAEPNFSRMPKGLPR